MGTPGETWAAQWVASWAAQASRFNPYHKPPGPLGGEFTFGGSAGGHGTRPTHGAKGFHAVTPAGHGVQTPALLRERRQIEAKIHADEARIRVLEHELHVQQRSLHAAAA